MDFCSYKLKQATVGRYGFLFYDQGRLYAYKNCNSEGFGLPNLREIDITSRLKHPNILNNIKIITEFNCQNEQDPMLIFPLIPYNLIDIYKATTEKKLMVIKQLLDVIDFLHRNGVIHCNLSPKNILITDLNNPSVLLTEFSSAQIYHCNEYILANRDYLGVENYIDPELFQADANIQKYNDIWSLGAIIAELILGENISQLLYQWDLESIKQKMERIDPNYRQNLFQMIIDFTNPDCLLRCKSENIKKYFVSYQPEVVLQIEVDRTFQYDNDLREIMKTMLKNMHRKKYTTKEVFIAFELFFRAGSFYLGDFKKLATTTIRMAEKLCRNQYLDNKSFLKEIKSDLNSTELDQIELMIVTNLDGKLYYNQLFSLCQDKDAIETAINDIILDRDRVGFASYNPDKAIGIGDPKQNLVIAIDDIIQY